MLSQRDVVAVDIATEDPSNSEYKPEQDCTKFKSSKTGRGPLDEGWKVCYVYVYKGLFPEDFNM
jgi:hypothetical protein